MSKKISQLTLIPTLSFNSSEYFPVNQSGETYKIPLSSVVSGIEYPTTDSRVVKTFSELQAANADTSVTKIILGADITVTSSIIIAATKTIFFQKYKFIKSGSATIQFLGTVEAGRYQIFSGYNAGNIIGNFRNSEIYPEWWGMITNQADVSINCAISATPGYTRGHKISLASGYYYTSAPIDLRGSLCRLEGAGAGSTVIYAVSGWTAPTWYSSQYYFSGGPMNGSYRPDYISGMLLMGGHTDGGRSFMTGIRGVTVNAYYAVLSNPTKKISGVHATGYIEENSIIEDINITNFNGFGIGIDTLQGTNTFNGLTIRNFWITSSMDRDSVPIMTGAHSGVTSIRDGTIACPVGRESTIYALGTPPVRPITWPVYGILATGNQTIIEGVHFEGMLIAILVWDPGFSCSVKISNISTTAMMESALPSGEMRWYNDYDRLSASGRFEPAPSLAYQLTAFGDPTAHQYINKYGSTIVIAKLPEKMEYNSAYAYNVTATISNVRNSSSFTPRYVLRDAIYGVHASAFGKGQYPNVTGTSSLGFYTRGQAWVHQTNSNDLSAYPYRSGTAGTTSVTNTAYSVSAPDTSRSYFLGPIY